MRRSGPSVPGGVVLSGHSDVVPVEGQDWHTDPYQLVERQGRLYGRGTCDMKGFLALVLSRLPDMRKADLRRPIQIAISRDEELGCVGAPPMIKRMLEVYPKASIVIVGEPTMMKVVSAHKGGAGFRFRVRGHEVHSSILHKGVSAVMSAARIVDWAARQNESAANTVPDRQARRFDPPFTTYHAGRIRGGTAMNITARDCEFEIEYRCVPGDRPQDCEAALRSVVGDVEAAMQKIHPESHVDIDPIYEVPPLCPEPDGLAEALARRLTGDNASQVVSYGTEAGQFQEKGYSVVVCGPGDIAIAHQPDEYLTEEQFRAGDAFIMRLIGDLCS